MKHAEFSQEQLASIAMFITVFYMKHKDVFKRAIETMKAVDFSWERYAQSLPHRSIVKKFKQELVDDGVKDPYVMEAVTEYLIKDLSEINKQYNPSMVEFAK